MHEPLDASFIGNKQFRFAFNLLNELVNQGLEHVVISPGSRSTPLVLAATAHHAIKETVVIDERSAAFFALGYARIQKKPIALICTSGTASAHYLPAIIEAYLQQLPLVVLSADRPIALRNSGANQTINQDNLFGEYAHFCSLNLFENTDPAFSDSLAALITKLHSGGPVQCNIHLDKPLEPSNQYYESFKKDYISKPEQQSSLSLAYLSKHSNLPHAWAKKISEAKQPVFVAGPSNDPLTFAALYEQISQLQIPIIAEQSSGYAHIVKKTATAENAFTYLGKNDHQQALKPDLIISSGQSPTHKSTLSWLSLHKDVPQIHFNGFLKYVQNGLLKDDFIPIKGKVESKQINGLTFPLLSSTWTQRWEKNESLFNEKKEQLFQEELNTKISEPSFYYFLTKYTELTSFCLGNSLVARDFDVFKDSKSSKKLQLFTTRGASGIDGLIAQAAGTALSLNHQVGLLIGDVSFQHDLGSLDILAKRPDLDVHLFVINNNGGRIFDKLPIKTFETLLPTYYHTTAAANIEQIAVAHKIPYVKITDNNSFINLLKTPINGSQISEISVDLAHSEIIRNLYQS